MLASARICPCPHNDAHTAKRARQARSACGISKLTCLDSSKQQAFLLQSCALYACRLLLHSTICITLCICVMNAQTIGQQETEMKQYKQNEKDRRVSQTCKSWNATALVPPYCTYIAESAVLSILEQRQDQCVFSSRSIALCSHCYAHTAMFTLLC